METILQLLKTLQKLVEDGHGNAQLYVIDTRSGVSEEASAARDVEIDVELASGEILEKGFAIYLG